MEDKTARKIKGLCSLPFFPFSFVESSGFLEALVVVAVGAS